MCLNMLALTRLTHRLIPELAKQPGARILNVDIDDAGADEIARRAGVNKAMLYYHVGKKDDLYLAVLEGAYEKIRGEERGLDLEHLAPPQRLPAQPHQAEHEHERRDDQERAHRGLALVPDAPADDALVFRPGEHGHRALDDRKRLGHRRVRHDRAGAQQADRGRPGSDVRRARPHEIAGVAGKVRR